MGCGTGEDALALAGLVGERGRVVGLDNSATMIVQVRDGVGAGHPYVEFAVGDVYALDAADGSFDAARADRVLHHLDEPLQALHEMVRVTRSGGRVAVSLNGTDAARSPPRRIRRRAAVSEQKSGTRPCESPRSDMLAAVCGRFVVLFGLLCAPLRDRRALVNCRDSRGHLVLLRPETVVRWLCGGRRLFGGGDPGAPSAHRAWARRSES